MVLDFQLEAAKRRHNPGRDQAPNTDRQAQVASARDRAVPRVEFGSGWYHAAAMKEAPVIDDHHDWH